MDDGRSPGVEEVKALQDLTAPASQDLDLHHLKSLQVPAHITGTFYHSDCSFNDEYIPFNIHVVNMDLHCTENTKSVS